MTSSSLCSLVVFATLLAAGCGPSGSGSDRANPTDVVIPFREDGELRFVRGEEPYLTVAIEIADTDSAIVRGLMQRRSLPERGGMLFLMPAEEPQRFWMANTPLSLDILFASEAGEIVSITRYTKPLAPDPVDSDYPARYVLELAAGFVDRHGVVEGDRIEWERKE
jgi:hypothetical protein